MHSPPSFDQLARQLKALASPKRLQIIALLMDGVHCNCELGEALGMPANLISHHMAVLREVGLVQVERDAVDARWVYFSMNEAALTELTTTFGAFFDPSRIQPRQIDCGPQGRIVSVDEVAVR